MITTLIGIIAVLAVVIGIYLKYDYNLYLEGRKRGFRDAIKALQDYRTRNRLPDDESVRKIIAYLHFIDSL